MGNVTVYGTDWCEDTTHARKLLEELTVPYKFVNIEIDTQSREWVKQKNGGKEKKPTIEIGHEVFSVPSDAELRSALERANLL